MYVIHFIDSLISVLEHCIKFKTVMMFITNPQNPILRIATNYNWYCIPDSATWYEYNTLRYEWMDRIHKKHEEG